MNKIHTFDYKAEKFGSLFLNPSGNRGWGFYSLSCLHSSQAVQQQKRDAEKSLIQLHKRTKANPKALPSAPAAAAVANPAATAAAGTTLNPFLAEPIVETVQNPGPNGTLTLSISHLHSAPRLSAFPEDPLLPVPEDLLLRASPYHVIFDR